MRVVKSRTSSDNTSGARICENIKVGNGELKHWQVERGGDDWEVPIRLNKVSVPCGAAGSRAQWQVSAKQAPIAKPPTWLLVGSTHSWNMPEHKPEHRLPDPRLFLVT